MCFPIATMALLQQLYSTASLMERTKTTSFWIEITLRTPLCHGPRHHDIGQTQSMHIRHQCLVDRTRLLVSSLFRIVHEIWYIHLTPSFVVVLSSQCNLIHNPKHQQSRSVLLALCSHLPFWSQACRSFQAKTLLRVLMSEPKFAPYTGLSANRWRKGSQSSALVVQCTWSALRSIYKERGLLW